MKRRISFIFAFALLCMSSVVAQVASGTCGDNLTWVLTEEGELIVEGTGDMYDYYEDSSGKINHPWLECRNQIKTITIGEGVTSIGNTAFRDCIELTSISLNDDLKHIGVEAFRYCGKLTAIDFPESLTSIANSSFFECRGLLSVTIPEGITNIDFSTFYDCSSLKSLILPSGMTSIGGDAFKACHNLTEIVCKATTPPSISSSTFSSVSREAFVYVPQASISAYESAEYWSEFTNFRPMGTCGENLTWRITPEDELIVEGTGAMYGYGWSDSPWFSHREFITEVVIPEGVTNIGEGIFWDCTGLAEITIPAGVTSIDNYAFSGCRNLVAVSVPESVKSIGVYAFQNCNSLTAITIPEGVMSIGNNTFENCNSLIAITIPEGVMNIGSNAFFGCSGLTSIACNTTTPPAIEDQWSLYGVDKSIPVYVPVSAVAAYKEAEGWKEFTNIRPMGTCGENLTWRITPEDELIVEGTGEMTSAPWFDIEEYLYAIKKATIMEGVTSIADAAFHYCTALVSISIPESVTSLGYHTFRNCVSLTDVTIPEGVTAIGKEVFQNCNSLTEVNIPEGVTSIGYFAFQSCI